MKEPVVVRTDVSAATNHVYMGRKEELLAEELKRNGIPAVGGRHGIHVTSGTLEVNEVDGIREFKWTPPEHETVHVPIPEGDHNLEVEELEGEGEETEGEGEEGEGEDATTDQPPTTGGKKKSKKKRGH